MVAEHFTSAILTLSAIGITIHRRVIFKIELSSRASCYYLFTISEARFLLMHCSGDSYRHHLHASSYRPCHLLFRLAIIKYVFGRRSMKLSVARFYQHDHTHDAPWSSPRSREDMTVSYRHGSPAISLFITAGIGFLAVFAHAHRSRLNEQQSRRRRFARLMSSTTKVNQILASGASSHHFFKATFIDRLLLPLRQESFQSNAVESKNR